jgi:hypothetical protein
MHLFIILALSLFTSVLPLTTLAQEEITPTPLATVNIHDVVSTVDGDTANISFNLENRTGVQPGVRYSIVLMENAPNGQVIADEKVYPDTLSLGEGSSLPLSVTYTAPSTLSGTYTLYIRAQNDAGFPFAYVPAGTMTLSGTPSSPAVIDISSCYLTILGEENTPHYLPTEGVDIDTHEVLQSTCVLTNTGSGSLLLTPTFTTKEGSSYGEEVRGEGGDATPVALAPNEIRTVTTQLPKAGTSGRYQVTLTYNDSNTIAYTYTLRGAGATIENIVLDKPVYESGDTAMVSFVWSPSGDMVKNVREGSGTALAAPTVAIELTSGGVSCGTATAPLTLGEPLTKVSIPVSGTCADPVAKVSISDSAYGLLAESTFTLAPSSVKGGLGSTIDRVAKYIPPLWVSLLGLLLGIALILYTRHRNRTTMSLPPTTPLVLLLLMLGAFLVPSGVRADTLVVPGSYLYDAPPNYFYVTISLNKGSYNAGETMRVDGYVSGSGNSAENFELAYRIDNIGTFVNFFNTNLSGGSFSYNGMSAPSGVGAHSLYIRGTSKGPEGTYEDLRMPFTVLAAPPQCSNGIDDDGDTKVDMADTLGCVNSSDTSEADATCSWVLSRFDTVQFNTAAPPNSACVQNRPTWYMNAYSVCNMAQVGPGMPAVSGTPDCYQRDATMLADNEPNTSPPGTVIAECSANIYTVQCTVPVPPPAPTSISAAKGACGTGYITVTWPAVGSAAGYELEINGAVVQVGNVISYVHSGLTPGSSHSYRVRAINGSGHSGWTSTDTETAPSVCNYPDLESNALSFSMGPYVQGSSISLQGTVRNRGGVSTGGGFTDEFRYQWGGTGGVWQTFSGNTVPKGAHGSGASTDDNTTFTPNQTGNLYIRHCVDSANAINESVDESPNCRTSGALSVIAPAASGNISATNCSITAGNNSCTSNVSWNTANASAVSVRQDGTEFSTAVSSAGTPRTIVGHGTTATFRVYNSGVEIAPAVTASALCTGGTAWDGTQGRCVNGPNQPNPPTAVANAACGSGQVSVTWPVAAGATTYTLRDNGVVIPGATAVSGTSYSHTGLGAGTSHTYTVRANNAFTSSAYSDPSNTATVASACLPDLDANPPSLSTTNVVQGQTISFTTNVRNVGTGVAGPYNFDGFFIDWNGDGNADYAETGIARVTTNTNPGANSDQKTFVWTVPLNAQPTNHYVGYFADSDNEVAESNDDWATSQWSYWSAPFMVSVNNPPVITANSIATTSTSVRVTTVTATDAQGVGTVSWVFKTGPGPTPTITNGTTLTPTISGLTVAGTYAFEVTVADAYGKTSVATLTIVVSSGGTGCTWQNYTDPPMSNWLEIRNCVGLPPSQNACTAADSACGFGGGWYGTSACPGGAAVGGAATGYSAGYQCYINSSKTVNTGPGGPAEGGMCYARALVVQCSGGASGVLLELKEKNQAGQNEYDRPGQ